MPRIPSLPALTTAATDDELPIEDVSASTTKKMTLTKLKEWLQSLTSWITTAMLNNGLITPDKLGLGAATATVATSQTTTSSSPGIDLATPGPSVTVTVGANGQVLLLMTSNYSNNTLGEGGNFYYIASGANTIAATAFMNTERQNGASRTQQIAGIALVTGLSPGSTTFKLAYGANTGGTSTYAQRVLTAIPL